MWHHIHGKQRPLKYNWTDFHSITDPAVGFNDRDHPGDLGHKFLADLVVQFFRDQIHTLLTAPPLDEQFENEIPEPMFIVKLPTTQLILGLA